MLKLGLMLLEGLSGKGKATAYVQRQDGPHVQI
jgi:hypothetical protein